MTTQTQTRRHLARDTKRLKVVQSLALAFAVVAALALAVSLGSTHPPRALVDDSAQVR